jgi:hypothetical protein
VSLPNLSDRILSLHLDWDRVLNVLLASIALEKIRLADIINGEGEKIQHAIGTKQELKIDDMLAINSNVKDTLKLIVKNELLMDNKLKEVFDILSKT